MFGIGGIEFLIIAVVAIVVIGPAELPRVLYTLGKGIRKMREVSRSITDAFDDITRDAELDEIISKANTPGGDNLDFHAQQQKALEERRAREQEPDPKEEDYSADVDNVTRTSASTAEVETKTQTRPSEKTAVKKSPSKKTAKTSSTAQNKKKGG